MPTPKSVVKFKKGNVEYKSNVDACNYYIFELCRAALRDSAKVICRAFRDNYYSVFKKITGDAGKATKYKVWSGKNTQYPRVQIGVKTGKIPGFYAYMQEFGSSKQPKLGLLQKSVQDNIPKIIEVQSKYLSGLEDEALAQSLIHEGEMEGDANE